MKDRRYMLQDDVQAENGGGRAIILLFLHVTYRRSSQGRKPERKSPSQYYYPSLSLLSQTKLTASDDKQSSSYYISHINQINLLWKLAFNKEKLDCEGCFTITLGFSRTTFPGRPVLDSHCQRLKLPSAATLPHMPQSPTKRRLLPIPRFQKSEKTHHETLPLLPLTADTETSAARHSEENESSSVQYFSIDGYYPATTHNIMSSPVSPGGGNNSSRHSRKGSLLGASKKVVSSAMRRPLKSLGRAVSRREKTRAEEAEVEALVMVENGSMGGKNIDMNGYGSIQQVEDQEGILAVQSSLRSSNGMVQVVPHPQRGDWPVHSMEQIMRTILLLSVAYIVGAKEPGWVDIVARISEYVLTAWITCVLILMLAFFQRKFPQWVPGFRGSEQDALVLETNTERPLHSAQSASLLKPKMVPIPSSISTSSREMLLPEPDEVVKLQDIPSPRAPDTPVSHPSLSKLYVVDTNTNERIYCNTEVPTHISTEWFEMDTMILIRTPDVDDPSAEQGLPCNSNFVDYLRDKQRRFEFQFQMKLKKVPQGKSVYFSCELDEPIKMGMIQRAFVGAAMAFMKSSNPTFHYSITGSKERSPDGKYERPHMSFTVEASLDRLVVSKPNEPVPELGTVIIEDPESIKRRKKGGLVDWNLEDTYTMALWSSYVDFLDWRVINLPGIRPFGLSSVLGSQAFHLTMYMIDKKRTSDKHYQKDLEYVVNWELGNDQEAEKGPYAVKWAKTNQHKRVHRARSISTESRSRMPGSASGDEVDILPTRSFDEYAIEEVEDDDDAETAAELGEGIYMRSGDNVCLREFMENGEDDSKRSIVANGGGFAVLQEQDVQVIIEKTRRSKKNRLIKSGDTVMFKMVSRSKKDSETRYLTIHRGWWLKWVTTVPSKNGFFTISNFDASSDSLESCGQTTDSQTPYLTMDGPFTLRHKRWSSYFVGVSGEPSPTYGGRLLGLYNPKKTQQMEEQYQSDEGEAEEGEPDIKAAKLAWMKPLVMTATEPQDCVGPATPSPRMQIEQIASDFKEEPETLMVYNAQRLTFCHEHAHADVPAWIEMMNRRDRVRQLAYVVRVGLRPRDEQKLDNGDAEDAGDGAEKANESFFRLRTGRELAQIMRVGQRVTDFVHPDESPKNRPRLGGTETANSFAARVTTPKASMIPTSKPSLADGNSTPPLSGSLLALSPQPDRSFEGDIDLYNEADEESELDASAEFVHDDVDDGMTQADEVDEEIEEIEIEVESDTDESDGEEGALDGVEDVPDASARKKRRGMMGKSKALLGKSVKATAGGVKMTAKLGVGGVKKTAKLGVRTTKLTGKAALGTAKFSAKAVKGAGKLTGKAAASTTKVAFRSGKKAVNAGKTAGRAVIAPVSRKSKKPPKTEPKTKQHKEKEQVSVSRRLKRMAKNEKKKAHAFVAGELCAPEQTRRTASRVLSRMSSLPINAPYWKDCNAVLKSQVQPETDQDRWFLEGTSVELGVTPLSGENSRGKIIRENVVARCLWESHWREEWSGVYDSCVSFYTPLSKSPCLEIAFIDITTVRPLAADLASPLPGFPMLVLETAWLCHYIAFNDEVSRDTYGEKIEAAIETHIKQVEATASLQEEDLRKARFWQGFQSLSESSLSSGNGKWAKLSSKDKLKSRTILNGRRMAFDSLDSGDVDMSNGFAFVEDLLGRALSFSLESLENDPESFIEFLDLSSQLRVLPLDEIDFSSKSSLCLFANIYHCLLQQAMLLSVNGPLHKKSVNLFMRTACYEIGDDVFSLAELYCCVLRGKMSKPLNPKPPYIEAPKKSQLYKHYALECRDPRVNFVLNTGDLACPRDIPILRQNIIEDQLNEAAAVFLQQELEIHPKKCLVILPKVCEVYKNDFGGDSLSCLKFCLGGLDEGTASTIRLMMMDQNNLMIRYRHTAEQYHTSLTLRDDDVEETEGGYEI